MKKSKYSPEVMERAVVVPSKPARKLTYDPNSKCLTFTARYSVGLGTSYVKAAPDREAWKVLIFSSVVRPQSISGS